MTMIFKNIELHNVCETQLTEDGSGVYLRRFPCSVRSVLTGASLLRSLNSSGCEIRFASDSDEVYVTLMSKDNDSYVYTYSGDYLCERVFLPKDTKITVSVKRPVQQTGIDKDVLKGRFDTSLYRIFISCSCECIFYGVNDKDSSIKAPDISMKPKIRWYAYGSSVTQGIWSIISPNSYIHYAAQRLGVDVFCKGMSGTCFCEKEMIDYLATCNDWDFITMEIGLNMYEFTLEEFKRRTSYAIDVVCEKNKDKSVFVITPFPNIASFGNDKELREKHIAFTNVLKRFKKSNLKIIDGNSILDDFTYLSHDLLHPTDYGHVRMGENLAQILLSEYKLK